MHPEQIERLREQAERDQHIARIREQERERAARAADYWAAWDAAHNAKLRRALERQSEGESK